MTKGLLYVESEPGELPVEEYQDWYDNEHVPLRMDNNLPEFLTGCRYQAADGKTPSFTAAYEVTDSDFFNDRRYSDLRANRSKREANLVANLGTLDRRSYNLVGITGPEKLDKPAQYVLTVDIDTKMSDSELDNWYEEEHLDKLSKLPGWLRTSRYVLIGSLNTGKGRDPRPDIAPRRFTLYEFSEEGKDVLSSPELQEANSTPRAKDILSKCSLTERLWQLYRAYPNTAHGR